MARIVLIQAGPDTVDISGDTVEVLAVPGNAGLPQIKMSNGERPCVLRSNDTRCSRTKCGVPVPRTRRFPSAASSLKRTRS